MIMSVDMVTAEKCHMVHITGFTALSWAGSSYPSCTRHGKTATVLHESMPSPASETCASLSIATL